MVVWCICRMKAFLDTSVNMKSADDDVTDLIFDKNIYRTGQQVFLQRAFFTIMNSIMTKYLFNGVKSLSFCVSIGNIYSVYL